MSDEALHYDEMVEAALKDVMRAALVHAATDGLPGEHHFYITFETAADGVDVHETLRAQHPDEMTIVLQHRFWELEVEADHFAVTLSFDEVPRRLVIPFSAVTAFVDPSVQFGLKFGTAKAGDDTGDDTGTGAGDAGDGAGDGDAETEAEPANADEPGQGEPSEEKTGEVITLDFSRRGSRKD